MTAEEIIEQGALVDTKYHYFSATAEQAQDPTNRIPYQYVYELDGEQAAYTIEWEGDAEDWYYTGINTIEKVQ